MSGRSTTVTVPLEGADAQAATAIPNTIDTKKTLVLIISIISSILLIPETPHYPADLNGTPHNIRNTERIIPDQTIRSSKAGACFIAYLSTENLKIH